MVIIANLNKKASGSGGLLLVHYNFLSCGGTARTNLHQVKSLWQVIQFISIIISRRVLYVLYQLSVKVYKLYLINFCLSIYINFVVYCRIRVNGKRCSEHVGNAGNSPPVLRCGPAPD